MNISHTDYIITNLKPAQTYNFSVQITGEDDVIVLNDVRRCLVKTLDSSKLFLGEIFANRKKYLLQINHFYWIKISS